MAPPCSLPTIVLRHWHFSVEHASTTVVLPDGCRDLIVARATDGAPRWFISPLADSALQVAGATGERFAGLRFHPAVRLDEAALLAAASRLDADDPLALGNRIEEHARLDTRVAEALQALASGPRVTAACRALGVSERSLERLLQAATARSPRYWQGLARARRAAAALAGGQALAEIAADHGYADQAHMNRAFRRWFATTPARLRADPVLLAMALEPGYA